MRTPPVINNNIDVSQSVSINVGVTDTVRRCDNSSQRAAQELTEAFQKTNTDNSTEIPQQEEDLSNKELRHKRIRNGLLIVGGAILTAAAAYLAVKGLKSNNISYDKLLQKAKNSGSVIEEVEGGVNIRSEFIWNNGNLKKVPCGSVEPGITEIAFHQTGNAVPSMVTRYAKNNPVVQRMIMEDGTIKRYILDRTSGYGVEYIGYNDLGAAIKGENQVVNIIDREGKALRTYTGEEVENALLVKEWASHDGYSKRLLNPKQSVTDCWTTNIVGWQATDGTQQMVNAGKSLLPENFTYALGEASLKPYTAFATETGAFSARLAEYNEYARLRNLTIEEVAEKGAKTLQFKNEAGQVVRTVTEDGTSIFNKFNRSGNLIQSAVRGADGEMVSRTVNEYRPFWNRCTGSATIDYTKNELLYTDIDGKVRKNSLQDGNGRYFFTCLLEQ